MKQFYYHRKITQIILQIVLILLAFFLTQFVQISPTQQIYPAKNIASEVNDKRKITIPNVLRPIYINKLTIVLSKTLDLIIDKSDFFKRINANPIVLMTFFFFYFLGIFSTSRFSFIAPLLFLLVPGIIGSTTFIHFWITVILILGEYEFYRIILWLRENKLKIIPEKHRNDQCSRLDYKPILLLIVISLLVRTVYLKSIPTGVNGDELGYAITDKTVITSGTDFSGTWKPIDSLLFKYPPGVSQAELPYLYLLPIIKFFGVSIESIRIPGVIFGVLTVVLIYLISRRLFGENTGRWVGLSAAINPWLIYISRTGYEATPSMFFFMMGLYLIIQQNVIPVILSVIPFIFAFYSYIGTKPSLLPFILTSMLIGYKVNKNKRLVKVYSIIMSLFIIFTVYFAITLLNNHEETRINDILVYDFAGLIKIFTDAVNKIPDIFSIRYLFRSGDTFFSLYEHGLFYLIDFIFLIIGLSVLYSKQKKYFILFTALIITGIFPQLIHRTTRDNFTPHITLFIPTAIILIGLGIQKSIESVPKKYRNIFPLSIYAVYIFSFLNFIMVYFFQYPLQAQSDSRMKIATEYINRLNTLKNIHFVVSDNRDAYIKYLFYQDAIQKNTIVQVKNAIKNKKYKINNISFEPCNNTIRIDQSDEIYFIDPTCGDYPSIKPHIVMPRLIDNGTLFKIYNEELCKQYSLQRYIIVKQITDLITTENNNKFCETNFIIN